MTTFTTEDRKKAEKPEDTLATHEEQQEWEKNTRKYQWNGVAPSVNAQWNVTVKDPWDEFKMSKDIV